MIDKKEQLKQLYKEAYYQQYIRRDYPVYHQNSHYEAKKKAKQLVCKM